MLKVCPAVQVNLFSSDIVVTDTDMCDDMFLDCFVIVKAVLILLAEIVGFIVLFYRFFASLFVCVRLLNSCMHSLKRHHYQLLWLLVLQVFASSNQS